MLRKLCFLLITTFVLFLPSIEITRPFTGISLQKAKAFHSYSSVRQLSNYDLIKKLVIIPKQIEQPQQLDQMLTNINSIDRAILMLLNKNGVKIRLFQGGLTDEPLLYYMKWDKPRGWKQDVTWADVPGSGGGWIVSAKIGASQAGNGHGSLNLELHEIGHTVFNLLFKRKEFSKTIRQVWEEECRNLYPGRDYFSNYLSEYFSESFALYYYSEETRAELIAKAPKTAQLFSTFETLNITPKLR